MSHNLSRPGSSQRPSLRSRGHSGQGLVAVTIRDAGRPATGRTRRLPVIGRSTAVLAAKDTAPPRALVRISRATASGLLAGSGRPENTGRRWITARRSITGRPEGTRGPECTELPVGTRGTAGPGNSRRLRIIASEQASCRTVRVMAMIRPGVRA